MTPLFHGPLRYWAVLVVVLGLLAWMGYTDLHTHHFNLFLIALIAIALGTVTFAVATYRKGERVTRDPIEDDDGA